MKKVIAIVGMAGSGKSKASAYFSEKGFEALRFGSVVDEGIKQEGKKQNPQTEKYYREKIRHELGMAAIAIKMLPKIRTALSEGKDIVLDGLYSWEEYVYLKKEIPELQLLCIYAAPVIRYERLQKRSNRPFSQEEAQQRDGDEIEHLNKGGPIAVADHLIKNETTEEDLREALTILLKEIV